MKFNPGSDNFERWKQAVEKYCPSLKREMNRLRALYQGALDKKGEKLTCMENFAVIAVHSPESIAVKGGIEFTACRCHVAWSGDDFQVNPITTITRKKKKQPEVTQVVKKKKKQPIEKIVIKKKKHRIDS